LSGEQSGDPVFDADPFLNEIFALTVWTFTVLLGDTRHPDDAANLPIAGKRRRQNSQEPLSVKPIGLGPSGGSAYKDTRGLHDVIDNAMRRQQPMQPKPIAPGFEATGDNRFGAADPSSRLAPQIRDNSQQLLGCARRHTVHFDLVTSG